jgi:hypothetical protein
VYERLDRSAGDVAARVRALLDDWFSQLPADARESIRPRFTSPRRETHMGAFFELYVHALASGGGYDIANFDVGQEDPEHIRPDVLLVHGSEACSVEATVALGDDVVDPVKRARVDQLYDAIERIRNRNFWLTVDVRGVGRNSPGRRTITAPLDRWLDDLNPDAEIARVAAGGRAAARTFEWEGWKVIVRAHGYKPELRGHPDLGVIGERLEGFGGHTHRFEGEKTVEFDGPRPLSDDVMLARALRAKAKHPYEIEDHPFVIAVLCAGSFVEDREIAQALLGPIEYRYDIGGGGLEGEYNSGGLWLGGSGWRYPHVSGVVTAANLTPNGIAAVQPTLWTNPKADHPVPAEFFPWRRMNVQPDGTIEERRATRSVAEVLGISPRFPAE